MNYRPKILIVDRRGTADTEDEEDVFEQVAGQNQYRCVLCDVLVSQDGDGVVAHAKGAPHIRRRDLARERARESASVASYPPTSELPTWEVYRNSPEFAAASMRVVPTTQLNLAPAYSQRNPAPAHSQWNPAPAQPMLVQQMQPFSWSRRSHAPPTTPKGITVHTPQNGRVSVEIPESMLGKAIDLLKALMVEDTEPITPSVQQHETKQITPAPQAKAEPSTAEPRKAESCEPSKAESVAAPEDSKDGTRATEEPLTAKFMHGNLILRAKDPGTYECHACGNVVLSAGPMREHCLTPQHKTAYRALFH